MKKVILAASCIFVLSFTSCKTEKNIPNNIKTSITKMYPGISSIDWDKEDDGTWEAEFKNKGIKTSVTFLANGVLKEVEEEIALSTFPTNAQQYIQQNYSGKKVKDISKITDSKGVVTYEAEVDKQDLLFDAQGNFIIIENEDKDSDRDSKAAATTTVAQATTGKLDIAKLPQQVRDFVAKNYPGYDIKNAEHDPMCNGDDAIDVAIRKEGKPAYSVIFSPKWEFIQQEEDVDLKEAPAKVKETLKNKFADYKIEAQIERLTLANKTLQYSADLSKGNTAKEVVFNADGSVSCSH